MQGNGNQTKEEEKNVNHKKNSKELKSANGANGGGVFVLPPPALSGHTKLFITCMYMYV